MKCPVCKKTIPEDSLKCIHCNSRIGLRCKNCNTVNPIKNLNCSKCGKEILKICPDCKSVNFPNAKTCRKCGKNFYNTNQTPQTKTKHQPKTQSKLEILEILINNIPNPDKRVFLIQGPSGCGKSEILQKVINHFKDDYIYLHGKSTPLTQLTPGGLIQDIVINIFGLPNFCPKETNFKNNIKTFFKNEFSEMTSKEISDLVNFIYASKIDKFENIQDNKRTIFSILNKIFEKITKLKDSIIIVDNFSFIDGFSYEFLNNIIKNSHTNTKLIVINNEIKPINSYLFCDDNDSIINTIIEPLNESEIENICNDLKDEFSYTNEVEKNEILTKSQGNITYIKQALRLCFDCQLSEKPFVLPNSFEEIIKTRINILKELNPNAHKILMIFAIIDNKINTTLIKELFNFEENEFYEIVEYLTKMQFIKPLNESYYEFINLLQRDTILNHIKTEQNFIDITKNIIETIDINILNSAPILATLTENLKQPKLSIEIWTKIANISAYIGDINLYVMAQKQCLALINEFEDNSQEKMKYSIFEKLGKILSEYNPTEAIEFLPDAINYSKLTENTVKEIELLGYLSNCCSKTNNYYGNIECVDAVISKTDKNKKLELALLKTAKLNSLEKIGNVGEIINLIENDILPTLDEYLTKKYGCPFDYVFLYETLIKTYLILANALIVQGNDRSFEVLTILFDIIEKNTNINKDFVCKCELSLAFANTIKGDFHTSEDILNNIEKDFNIEELGNEIVIQWNLVKVINKIFNQEYENFEENLFEIVVFANNCKNDFMKNILKTFLGKYLYDNNQI